MAVIRCPNCGKPNPEFLEACQYCDAPLKGGQPVEAAGPTPVAPAGDPPHAPQRPVGGDDDALIRPPVWDTPADAATAPTADENLPDWMLKMRQRQESELPPEPDWMWTGAANAPSEPATPPPAPPPIEPDVTDTTDLPPWLASLSGEPTPAPEASAVDLPPWLQTGLFDQLPDDPDVTLLPPPKRKMTDWLNKMKGEVPNLAGRRC